MNIYDFSISNQLLISASMDMFRLYGRAILDILENKSNDLTDEQKTYWANQLIEVTNILGNYVKIAETMIESQGKENLKNLVPYKNAMWN